jgi:spoIIIJ-associated protein
MVMQDFLTQLLAHMGIDTGVVQVEENDDSVNISIQCDENESGLLIGRHAETLDAVQHTLRLLFQKEYEKPLVLNINDFRQHREEYLQDLATRVAARVVESGRAQTLRLNAHERRVIHMALADHPDVSTESEGEGIYRVLKVFPKEV